jgi:hypothetical protein
MSRSSAHLTKPIDRTALDACLSRFLSADGLSGLMHALKEASTNKRAATAAISSATKL